MVGLFRPHSTLKLLDLHFHSAYGQQTLQPGDLPWGASNHSVTRPLCHVVLPGHVADFKRLYVHYLMATKLSSMVTYLDCILPIKPDDDIITWFCEITWQTKNIISLLPQWLWPQNLAVWWLTLSNFYPKRHMTVWSSGLVRSCDKLK